MSPDIKNPSIINCEICKNEFKKTPPVKKRQKYKKISDFGILKNQWR